MALTQAQRNAAIKKLIKERTAVTSASREVARATLISEGVYTKKGRLRAEYGGTGKKSKVS